MIDDGIEANQKINNNQSLWTDFDIHLIKVGALCFVRVQKLYMILKG